LGSLPLPLPLDINSDIGEWVIKQWEIGLNPIPMNTKTNIPCLKELKSYLDTPPTRAELEELIKKGFFKNGVAQATGLCHRGKFEGFYLNCVDFDNESSLKKLLDNVSLEELSKDGIFVEQHLDNTGKAHLWILSEKPFPKFKSKNGEGMEVKSQGLWCNFFPSIHKDGHMYSPIGDSLKFFDDDTPIILHDKFIHIIDDILGGIYLNGKANKNTTKIAIDTTEKWREGARNNNLFDYAVHTLRKLRDTTPLEAIKHMVYEMNQIKCEPPLEESEFVKIFNSALNYSGEPEGEEKRQSKIKLAFETVRQQVRNLFVDEYKVPYISLPIQDHLEVLPVDSWAFKNWYRMFIFERDGIVLDNTTINDLCGLASAYAASHKYGTQIKLNLRTALKYDFKTEWIYDLVNKEREFIKINSSGWYIFKNEIIFRRYTNQKAQVYPDRNYEANIFDKFMRLVNTKDRDSILLLKCYIISLYIPEIQKVVLILHGSQGAAKSSLQELIRMLVDPSVVKTFTFPRDTNELIQQLSHNYVTYYDNVSIIKYWISDQLCRAVTGSGSSKRQLYTDDDDKIYSFKRCVGMNAINLAATKEDLLDRSIIINLEEIEDKDRRIPEELWREFNTLKPQLLGYILDILVKVLEYEENNRETIKKFKLSRMTEFAKYGEIISRCMGNKDGEFLNVYKKNREIQVDEIVEFSEVATVIMCMMFKKYGEDNGDYREIWDGTPTELYTEIKNIVETDKWELNIDTSDRYWPKNVKSLGRRLNEIKPTLKAKGLEITRYEEHDQQKTRKIKICKVLSETSETSEGDKSRSNLGKSSDDTSDDTGNNEKVLSEEKGQNHAQNQGFGRRTRSDDILRGSIGDVSKFIKLEGYQRGDKISYFVDSVVADLSIQNGFIGGRFSMRGEGNGRYPTNLLKIIDEIFGPEPYTIEVCSNKIAGLNKGGNCFTVDTNPEHKPDLVTDGQTLEGIEENRFNRWRCDPPYNEKTAKEMYNTDLPNVTNLLKACARVVKPGSLLFLLHEYVTPSSIHGLQKIGFIHITAVPNNGTRVLNIYVKLLEPTMEELELK